MEVLDATRHLCWKQNLNHSRYLETCYCLDSSFHSKPRTQQNGSRLISQPLNCKLQLTHFEADLDSLQRKQTPSNSSSLLSLQPFIDDSDVLRVGGRKQLSQTSSYQSRHPAILHGKHPLHMMNDDTTQTPYMQVLLYSYLDV